MSDARNPNQPEISSSEEAASRLGDALDDRLIAPTGERVYSEDGVDLTLIRWSLSLSPLERLEVLRRNLAAIQELRGGLRR